MPETPEFLKVVVGSVEPLLTLPEVKEHLRVDDDDSDGLIVIYANAAVQRCLDYCGLKLVPIGGETVFRVAALLVTGDLFSFRETAQVGSVSSKIAMNPSAEALLETHRIYRV